MLLKLRYDGSRSNFCFNVNVRRHDAVLPDDLNAKKRKKQSTLL
jgi:hypothetical protein